MTAPAQSRTRDRYRYYEAAERLLKIVYVLAWAPRSLTREEVASALLRHRIGVSPAVLYQDLARLHRMGVLRRKRRRNPETESLCRVPYEYRLDGRWGRVMEELDPDEAEL